MPWPKCGSWPLPGGPPPSSEGPAVPRDKREGRRARTWLRRSPSPPRLCFAAVPGPGRRPQLTFLCLPGLRGPTKPKYSHSPGGHMRAGERRGGAANIAAPQCRERAGTERPWHPSLGSLGSGELGGGVSKHKTACQRARGSRG